MRLFRHIAHTPRFPVLVLLLCGLWGQTCLSASPAFADSPKALASQLSNNAFGLLNSLNGQSKDGEVNPLVGQVASLASDAQSLSQALNAGNNSAAAASMAAIKADRDSVDASLASHQGTLDPKTWNTIKAEVDALIRVIPPASSEASSSATSAPAAPAPSTASVPEGAVPEASRATSAAAPSDTAGIGGDSAPKVVVDSSVPMGQIIRVKGYFEGTALKSAGIYEDGHRVKSFKVNDVTGRQRVNFDIELASPLPDTVMRVEDAEGRVARAPLVDRAALMPKVLRGTGPTELGRSEIPEGSGPPVSVFRGSGTSSGNTAEIPSHAAIESARRERHTHGGSLGNVQINILAVNQASAMPPVYEVVGQIAGRGVRRAGIYVNGRLVKSIPIESGSDYTSFDQKFSANSANATIRAYGAGNQYVESSVQLGNGTPMIAAAPPIGVAPGLSVQITSIRSAGPNLDVVTGVIYGGAVASAGLYQNGILVQNLPISNSIVGGILGALTGGATQAVNFTARFNPSAGQAVIRAFGTNGGYAEQPIVVAGVNPYGTTPYGTTPYGVSPYGTNPYGVNPYATNPYAVNPYARGINPYGGAANPYYPPTTNPYSAPPGGAATYPLGKPPGPPY